MVSILSTLSIIAVFLSGLRLLQDYARFNDKTSGRLHPEDPNAL